MNRTFLLIFLIALISCSKQTETSQPELLVEAESVSEPVISETIEAANFRELINTVPDAVILDVRTPGEFANGYIEGAINIDFRSAEFKTQLNQLDKNATYLVYCGSGGRSRSSADVMKELSFKKVYDLSGGFSQWKSNGFPSKLP